MSLLTFSIVVFSVVVAADADSVCPVQSSDTHQVRVHGNFCYQFHLRETHGFSAAQAECRSQGGSEVIIKDAETQQFLFDTIQKEFQYTGVVWIGLNDVSREGVFHWVDGSPMTYSNWASGEPGGLLGSLQDCAVMDMKAGGHWRDYRCEDFLFLHNPHPFICQFAMQVAGTGTVPPRTTAITTTTTTTAPATAAAITSADTMAPSSATTIPTSAMTDDAVTAGATNFDTTSAQQA